LSYLVISLLQVFFNFHLIFHYLFYYYFLLYFHVLQQVQKYSVDFELARKIGYHCGYSMFNCGRNLYDNDCWRELYR
jgi:hypothetical protein